MRREADKLGVDYMKQTGYDVKQAVRLWEKMGAASTERPQEWMSTHPDPTRRAKESREPTSPPRATRLSSAPAEPALVHRSPNACSS